MSSPSAGNPPLLRRFFREFMRPYLGLQILIGLCLLASVGLGLADPLVLRAIIDRGLAVKDWNRLLWLAGLLSVVLVARTGIRLAMTWLYSYSGLRVLFDLRRRLFEHVEGLSPYYFRGERLGDILARLTSDVDVLQRAAAHTVVNALSDALTIVGLLGAMIWLDPLLTGALILAYPALIWGVSRINNRLRGESRGAREAYGDLFAFLEERLSGIRLVQEFRREKSEARGHVRVSRPWIRTNLNLSMIGAVQVGMADAVATLAFILTFLLGGWRAMSGALTVGSLVAFYALATRLFRPINGLIEINIDLAVARASLIRIYELLDEVPAIRERPGARAPRSIRGAVSFLNVGMVWDEGTRVLDQVSFDIEPGTVVALVGPSGGGKSTLAALLPRFLDPVEGSVIVDGLDVREWPLSRLRGVIGLVPQETQVFHDTLASNLRLARPKASEAELLDVLNTAALREFVAELPQGIETQAGEGGLRLSGGERQRLALARALLKDPLLYVLDEATSALDPRTERQVLERFLARVRGKTVLVIAHRLTSITGADRIVVLDRGRIKEQGTHSQLYAAEGLYRRLFDDQLRLGEEPA